MFFDRILYVYKYNKLFIYLPPLSRTMNRAKFWGSLSTLYFSNNKLITSPVLTSDVTHTLIWLP